MIYTGYEWSNHCQILNKIHWRELPVCTWYVIYFWNQFHPVIVTKCYSNICGNIQQSIAWEQKKNRHLKAVIKIPPESLSKRFNHMCRVVVNNLCLVVDPYRDKIVSYLIVQEITWRQYTCVVWYLVFGWSARCAKGFFWTT